MHMVEGQRKVKLYTGSYNAPVVTGDGSVYLGKGKGIQVFWFDEEEGKLEAFESYPDVKNASWMAFSPNGRTLYAVNELDDYEDTKGGALSALSVDENGRLSLQNCLPVMGAAPCHVDCGPGGGHVFTANYNGGSLSSFVTGEDGCLKVMDCQISYQLKEDRPEGCNQVRQEKSHVHSASVFRGHLWVADLGTDEISVYKLDESGRIMGGREGGVPKACHVVKLPAGSGPRSLAFREDGHIYVSCELSDEIGILHWEGSRILLEGFVSCTPEKGDGGDRNFPGGILLSKDGNYLYAGNRGHDSIAVFDAGGSGLPKCIQWISSGGKNPRGFQLSPSERWLLGANQNSDNLVVFRRNKETGTLTEHARYDVGAVVCLVFLR